MAMKKNPEREEGQELEILKAVAQAWHGHSGNIEPAKEFDAYRSSFKSRPTRFKLEAMNKLGTANKREEVGANWDFRQSLWDSYEIVTLSKKLEAGLGLDHLDWDHGTQKWSQVGKKRKESKNSLRNLFNQMSSTRFNVQIPNEDDIQL
ncbi:uncharacterized protein LOC122654044 [Telopea speciosissima]|uniref:uncharacterized protein LOC122654044 n=1 Tax=Telopea speciosissima TaxID=54955 RepID=UPI001CC7246B|nr:uncharacterized protein LOC122654044 [Telopea speciosissima]